MDVIYRWALVRLEEHGVVDVHVCAAGALYRRPPALPPLVVAHVVHEVDSDVGLVGHGEAAAVERRVVGVVILELGVLDLLNLSMN